ncbi:MAG: dephospho-CoA kinase [Archangium sp.]|nr:dephospho-CoA kinase [Archangium sp.]
MRAIVIGITGCVGSGKSTVARALGLPVLDLDHVGASCAKAIGLNPAIALARIVGGDRALEAKLVPMVKAAIAQWLEVTPRPCVIDSALLFEQGLDSLCDLTVCLTCPAEMRRSRVAQRTTASASLFDQIEGAQWPEAKKAARATLALPTGQPLDEVIRQLRAALG